MNRKLPKRSIFNFETLIIVCIAACVLFLNFYTSTKISELQASAENAMFVQDGIDYPESEILGEAITEYRPGSCKMIEMYDGEFELLFSLQFNEAHPIHDDNIIAHPDLIKILSEDPAGRTTIEMDDYTEEIYFRWAQNEHGEDRLIIVYSCLEVVKNLWVFQLVCYLILILVFVLLIRLHLKDYNRILNRYEYVTRDVKRELR